MNRCTFEAMAPYWVASSDQLAEPMNKIPKVIFSKSDFILKTSYSNTTGAISPYASTWADAAVATDLVADIAKLKQQAGKLILAHGETNFAQEPVKHGLVDEYRFAIHPVVIGKGLTRRYCPTCKQYAQRCLQADAQLFGVSLFCDVSAK